MIKYVVEFLLFTILEICLSCHFFHFNKNIFRFVKVSNYSNYNTVFKIILLVLKLDQWKS